MIVSNRLPFVVEKREDGWTLKPGSGGLATALAPVLRDRGGVWIGWSGIVDSNEQEINALLNKNQQTQGFLFVPVLLSQEDVSLYYEGFSNEIIWPLFHDLQAHSRFVPEYWQAYEKVNAVFANVVLQHLLPEDFIWVHDYHLMLVGQELRKAKVQQKMGFFLHIPFPPLDIFLKLPWRFQMIHALLQYDLIGFQTMRDKRNFIECVKTLIKEARVVKRKAIHVCKIQTQENRISSFPISIDYREFERAAQSKVVQQIVKTIKESSQGQTLIFSMDRLDYTKGILYRLEAIRRFFTQYPEFKKKVQFIQLVVPSRTEIPKYQELKEQIERLIGEINGLMTHEGWVPIHHIYRSFTREELIAHYTAAEVMLVTSIKDGMNLVAKEYIASNIEEKGVVILSEFAGAAAQVCKEALLVNPYDVAGVAETIQKAVTMPTKERTKRMHKMRKDLKKHDIFWWVEQFLNVAIAKVLKDFPQVVEYIPTDDAKKG